MVRVQKEMYAIPADAHRKNVKYFSELFGVEELLNVQVRTLSLGERMKMELTGLTLSLQHLEKP